MISRPTAAARNTITAGTAPAGTAKPRVNSEDPASVKAETTPRGGSDLVTFFIAVDDIEGAVKRAGELGGQVVQEPQHVPGVAFALIADPQGHVVGLTQQG